MQSASEIIRERAEREGKARQHIDAAHAAAEEAQRAHVAFPDPEELAELVDSISDLDPTTVDDPIDRARSYIAASHEHRLEMSDEDRARYINAVRRVAGKGSLSDGRPQQQQHVRELLVLNGLVDAAVAAPVFKPAISRREFFDPLSREWVREENGQETGRFTAAEIEQRRTERAEQSAADPFGKPDRRGVVTLDPRQVATWPADRYLMLPADIREALLRSNGEPVTFTPKEAGK